MSSMWCCKISYGTKFRKNILIIMYVIWSRFPLSPSFMLVHSRHQMKLNSKFFQKKTINLQIYRLYIDNNRCINIKTLMNKLYIPLRFYKVFSWKQLLFAGFDGYLEGKILRKDLIKTSLMQLKLLISIIR